MFTVGIFKDFVQVQSALLCSFTAVVLLKLFGGGEYYIHACSL
jgi:hypothetical protein